MTRSQRRERVYDLASAGLVDEAERLADAAPSQRQRDELHRLSRAAQSKKRDFRVYDLEWYPSNAKRSQSKHA